MSSRPVDALQLWILTSVVEHPWYFPVLTSVEYFQRQSNLLIPDVTADALLQAMADLFARGCLSAELGRQPVEWGNIDQLREWIQAPESDDVQGTVYFGLSPAGGADWERECKADWSRYLNGQGSCSIIDQDGEEFTSWNHYEGATWSRVTEYARLSEVSSWHTRSRAKTRELRPWKATYWKTLPSGFRVSTKYRYGTEESKAIWLADRRTPRSARSKLSEFTRWYQDPA